MAEILKRNKPLSVSPVKVSATSGAALAFLGFDRSLPLLHGAQGCTAFNKIFFVRHFREPIPLQTTALDQISTVMGSDENLIEGLRTVCEKHAPALIGLPTTGLAETQGCDVRRVVRTFVQRHPEFAHVPIVPVDTPDYRGSFERGFALAVDALIEALLPQGTTRRDASTRHVNLLVNAHLTADDLDWLQETVAAFGLEPVTVPDLAASLDGHLDDAEFASVTTGGTAVAALRSAGEALATLVVGASLGPAADRLQALTGVPDARFDHLVGLAATDRLLMWLRSVSGQPVPARLDKQRRRLQDAMLDCHFTLGTSRFAIAAEADLLTGFVDLLGENGGEVVAAVAPAFAPVLERTGCATVKIGDLEDLEMLARDAGAELLIANGHGVESAHRLGVPILQAGFPQWERLGGFQRGWIGYDGARHALFDLANALEAAGRHAASPYRSVFAVEAA